MALTTLDLRNNRIGASAVASLADGLRTNSTLVTLDLRWNSAGETGAHALESALAQNSSLLRLPLQGNRVPESSLKRIESLLAGNGQAHKPAAVAHVKTAAGGQENAGMRQPAFGGAPAGGVGAAGGGSGGDAAAASATVTPLREAVQVRTLESAIVVQQAEFSNKLRHAQQRAEAAEHTVDSERSRADVALSRMAHAEESEGSARHQVAKLQQELTAARGKADAEVSAAKQAAVDAKHALEIATKAKEYAGTPLASSHLTRPDPSLN